MSIASISSATSSISSNLTKQADETLQQRAQQGDPIAIAELKAEDPKPNAAQPGAFEPGKGVQVDSYA
jgi:hypothetical protein